VRVSAASKKARWAARASGRTGRAVVAGGGKLGRIGFKAARIVNAPRLGFEFSTSR
jgi:hypothetical protein